MLPTRISTRHATCNTCHHAVLKTFITSFSLALDTARLSHQPLRRSRPPPLQRSSFSTRALYSTQATSPGLASQTDQSNSHSSPDPELEHCRQDDSLPWYLRDQEPQPDQNPFAQQQKLPDLPEHPPPILQPLLEHISIHVGLDYLTLLDLRHVDPPPALGSNLLMILGTARSEKHLNVSADRLCRWLRSTYKMKPYADGLLGRNELKLKIKRKARRAKLFGASGSSSIRSSDDGTGSGWICVNLGSVHTGFGAAEGVETDDTGFVGFGETSTDVKIVVQMMTEEKRGQVDLESLWQGVLRGTTKRYEQQPADLGGAEGDAANSAKYAPAEVQRRSLLASYPPSPLNQQIIRGFHSGPTSRFPASADNKMVSKIGKDFFTDTKVETRDPPTRKHHDMDALPKHLMKASHVLRKGTQFHVLSPEVSSNFLQAHASYLEGLGPTDARRALGWGQNDKSSTQFLRSFYACRPSFMEMDHWNSILELHLHAISINHPGYKVFRLVEILSQMELHGISIPAKVFQRVLECILLNPLIASPSDTFEEEDVSFAALNTLRRHLSISFKVLEKMEIHGHPVCTEPILLLYHEAISNPRFRQRPLLLSNDQKLWVQYQFQKTLAVLLHQPIPSVYKLAMLRAYAYQKNWEPFWRVWTSFPQTMQSRTPEMYALMFNAVADSGHQAKAMQTLEENVVQMARERPRVEMEGDVALGVWRCLNVAKIGEDNLRWRRVREMARAATTALTPELLEEGENEESWPIEENERSEQAGVQDEDEDDVEGMRISPVIPT